MKKPILHLLMLMALLPLGLAAQPSPNNVFDVALFGDMPYGTAREASYERLIADVNAYHPLFAVHIGDTKSGSTRCDDAQVWKTLNWFNSLIMPVVYSVGDNEWTDCMRVNNGVYNPVERLAQIRKVFFSTNETLGRTTMQVTRQSSAFPENAMLVIDPVVFVSIHTVGSNNNLEYKTAQGAPNPYYDNDVEFNARNAADLAWLRTGFQTARNNRSYGIVFLTQANMFESFMSTSTGAPHSGFADFITALRKETQAFDGQVVMVSGDSHYFRIDQPMTKTYPGCTSSTGDCKAIATPTESPGDRIYNFTRVEVPGDGDVHWVIAHIKPDRRSPFSFELRTVPGN
jgi:hypothetical protein